MCTPVSTGLYQSSYDDLATSLMLPSSLFQVAQQFVVVFNTFVVVFNTFVVVFNLLTTWDKQRRKLQLVDGLLAAVSV